MGLKVAGMTATTTAEPVKKKGPGRPQKQKVQLIPEPIEPVQAESEKPSAAADGDDTADRSQASDAEDDDGEAEEEDELEGLDELEERDQKAVLEVSKDWAKPTRNVRASTKIKTEVSWSEF